LIFLLGLKLCELRFRYLQSSLQFAFNDLFALENVPDKTLQTHCNITKFDWISLQWDTLTPFHRTELNICACLFWPKLWINTWKEVCLSGAKEQLAGSVSFFSNKLHFVCQTEETWATVIAIKSLQNYVHLFRNLWTSISTLKQSTLREN
jgi:hypothetical protein